MKIIKKLKYSFLAIIIFMSFITSASATNYYIAPWGDNSKTGLSLEQAWSSLSWAINNSGKVGAGTTILVVNGLYYEPSGFIIGSNNDGDAINPLLIKAYNGTPEIYGDFNTSNGNNYGIIIGGSQYKAYEIGNIMISNLTFRDYCNIFSIRNTNNITFNNNRFYNSSTSCTGSIGFVKAGSKDININNNSFGKSAYNSIEAGGGITGLSEVKNLYINDNIWVDNNKHGVIQIDTNSTNVYVQRNRLLNNTYGGGISVYKGTSDSSYAIKVIFSDNYLDESGGLGIYSCIACIFSKYTVINSTYPIVVKKSYADGIESENIAFRDFTIINMTAWIDIVGGTNLTFQNININKLSKAGYEYRVRDTVKGDINIIDEAESVFRIAQAVNISLKIKYLNNTVFKTSDGNITQYYPNESENIHALNTLFTVTAYPMTARPSSGSATVTVNSFDTSLSAGQVPVNFTANSTNGTNVHFTISTLTPGRNYKIKKGSGNFMDVIADGSGTIAFDNSQWSSDTFTVQESVEQGSGSASGTAARMNQTPIPNANVSLYYQNGVAYGKTVKSGADGKFVFSNIPNGYYYVAVDKQLFRPNTSSVFNINSTSRDIGSIKAMCYDVNGDNKIDVLDINLIGQHINEKTGSSYPAFDVNGDGVIDIHDVRSVSGEIEEK